MCLVMVSINYCVPKLPNGACVATANAVMKAVDDWKLTGHVRAACLDTTANNTGEHSGACHMFEELLQRSLVYLPCRHHILEIVIGAVFDMCLGCSTGPDVKLFVRFKNNWSFIDVSKYQTAYDDDETASILRDHQRDVDEVITFVRRTLEAKQPEMITESCASWFLSSLAYNLTVVCDFNNQEHIIGPGGWLKSSIH